MKTIVETLSFYPFSFHPLPEQRKYAIERFNIVKHEWVTIEERCGDRSDIEDYVRELNEDGGIIKEQFIVGYED